MVGTSPILLLLEPPAGQGPPANAHIPAFLAPPAPFQIESWRQLRKQGPYGSASGLLLGPAVRPLEIESRLELFYTFSLLAQAQASSSCLLSLRVNTSSGPGAVLSVECVEVWGSGWCAVEKADLEPVQLGGNQLYQDEFLCPEALAGQ